MADGRGLRGLDVAGIGHVRVAGQAAVHVVFHADQVTDQALHVQAAQGGPGPVVAVQAAQRRVKRVRRPAERLLGRYLRSVGDGTASLPRQQRRRQHALAQPGWQLDGSGWRRS